jgi:hypothetical protein
MKLELDKLLCEKYPKMMVNRNKDMKETCMCWGFDCGDGWYNIINQLCANIQHHIDWKNRKEEIVPQVTVDQVKEKFGSLRFYFTGGDDYIRGMATMAESMSGVTCEECGNPGSTLGRGWLTTLCEKHAEERGIYNNEEEE